ncbi:MAG: hypothetical protein KDE27_02745 [Planctomycetes bacterium]|nr:hypothetical protein [Planctomycetota bacterium]
MKLPVRAFATAAVLSVCACSFAAAQDDLRVAAVGLHWRDGELWGGSDHFKVRFDPGSIEYTPALPAAPRSLPMTLRVVGCGRGGSAAPMPAPVRPTNATTTVTYVRPGFVERYEVRPEGVEQSFVFERLPAGAGDLVVRLQVDTELLPRPASADGALEFANGEFGGIRIAEVVGIDAAGRRAAGSLRRDGEVVELRLPAAFVDSAALPLVLDPLISTVITVASGSTNHVDPDVAYDASTQRYLVVFTQYFSLTDQDVVAQRFSVSGSPVGARILVDGTALTEKGARVANVNVENTFLVVYMRSPALTLAQADIVGRAISASTGAISARATIEGGTNHQRDPDVGGEATQSDDEAIVVWNDETAKEIRARQVNVDGSVSPPTVTPFGGAAVLIADSPASLWTDYAPVISKSGGTTGNHLIAWNRQFSSSPNTSIRGAIIDRSINVLEDLLDIALAATDNDLPDVDGDGRNWLVVWEQEATANSGDNGIAGRAVGWNPNAAITAQGFFHGPAVIIEDGSNDDEREAHVAWLGESALVTYVDNFSGANDDIYVQSVDVFSCQNCEGVREVVANSLDDEDTIRAASRASGGDPVAGAMIVYRRRDISPSPGTLDGDIFGRGFAVEDGVVSNLGGGCGGDAGVPFANCAAAGFSGFASRMRGAAANRGVWLVISPDRLDVSCGACTLVPDLYGAFVFASQTDARGDATFATPLPNSPGLRGIVVHEQWLVFNPSTGACAGMRVDMSDALHIRIQ